MKTSEQINARITELRLKIDAFDTLNAECHDWELYDSWSTELYSLEWVLKD